ncbi:MAG TPA: S8 family serine peptidase [Bacillota bacterium]|nr:S8 family serine peptidase [Bacillota bacterium]
MLVSGCSSASFGEPYQPPLAPDPQPGVHTYGKVLGHVVMETAYNVSGLSISDGPGVVVQGTTRTKPLAPAGCRDYRDSDILVSFRENASSEEIENLVGSQGCHVKRVIEGAGIYVIGISEGRDPVRAVEDFKSNSLVRHAQPNWVGRVTDINDIGVSLIPNDPNLSRQWAIDAMGLRHAWDKTRGSSGVTVAVIDTGVQVNHPDLVGNIISGYDFYNRTSYVTDHNGHGTHIAGIIGAATNNGLGIAGINWSVSIMPLKAADDSGGGYLSLSEIIEALRYAADHGADVVNMSFQIGDASSGEDFFMEEAIEYAYNKGVTMIAAAGNEGQGWLAYPARHSKVIAVGAIGPDLNRASWSNYGNHIDVVAPGDSIVSTWPMNTFASASGTSMAAPQVAGVAALLISSGVRGPENIRQILHETAMDLGTAGYDDVYGWGLVNAHAAVNGALITEMKIFAGDDDGVSVTPRSEMTSPAAGGFFEIRDVEKGSWHVYGWTDINKNGVIDEGDYFGRTSSKITLTGGVLTGIELRVRPNIGAGITMISKLAED